MDCFIGTSGYDYPEWKGIFYPEKLPRKDFLSFYATHFNALELNNTFYNMPTKERIESYVERSEGKLHFSLKVPKIFTHEVGCNLQTASAELKAAVSPMVEEELLTSFLFQFPHNFDYSVENRKYLSCLLNEFKDYHCVVEFRNKNWSRASVFESLVLRNTSIAFPDMPKVIEYVDKKMSSFVGPEAYGRLHARQSNTWYSDSTEERYHYSEGEMLKFLPGIKLAFAEGRRCQFYFNNDPNGSGLLNALMLREMVKNL